MVKYWGERVVLNVDEPISERWQSLLIEHGYGVAGPGPPAYGPVPWACQRGQAG